MSGASFRCYWCHHAPVTVGGDCPKCGTHIEVVVPEKMLGDNPFVERVHVAAYKELVLGEDRRVLDFLARSNL